MNKQADRAPASVVRMLAPAKVNPFLEVQSRRDDGYHELETLMVALDLADELELALCSNPGVHLELSGEFASDDIPSDERNLAVRASALVLADALERGLVPESTGINLRLVKKIPSQAGLGGGSSDAAAACLGTAILLGKGWQGEQLRAWLTGLGSDCVFFHDAAMTGFARCKGRGELVHSLEPIDPSWCFALLAPELRVPTGEVFGALTRVLSERAVLPSVPERLFFCPEAGARLGLFNRLEAAALSAIPALGAWRNLLDQNGAQHYLLSGSGSTYFGLYRNQEEARASLQGLVRAARQSDLEVRGTWVAKPLGGGTSQLPSH